MVEIVDKESKKEKFVHIKDNLVSEVTPQDIRNFCVNFIEDLPNITDNVFHYNIDVINHFLNAKRTSVNFYNDLPIVELDFKDNDRERQFLYLKNRIVEITANEVKEHCYGTIDKYVWENKIVQFDFKRLDKSFVCETNFDRKDNYSFDKFEMLAKKSHFQEINQLGFKIEDFIVLAIQYGDYKVKKSTPDRKVFESEMFRFIISTNYFGKKKQFLLTAFDLRKKLSPKN